MVLLLVHARCPRCRSREIFPASKIGKSVECGRWGKTRAKFKLPPGKPFGADQWDTCQVPLLLRQCLELHKNIPKPRTNAAFAIALVRAVYPKHRSVWLRRAVAACEKFFETGTAPPKEMSTILDGLMQGQVPWVRPGWAQAGVCCLSGFPLGWPMCMATDAEQPAIVANLIRDVMPNPFKPLPHWPAWRTSTVQALAAEIDSKQQFDLMPILADALEDAGCDATSALIHLRGPGPHTRACWIVDAILGKA